MFSKEVKKKAASLALLLFLVQSIKFFQKKYKKGIIIVIKVKIYIDGNSKLFLYMRKNLNIREKAS